MKQSIESRFWSKVDRQDPATCWPWKAYRDEKGYGRIGRGGRGSGMALAHRISWEINVGPIPQGLNVLHRCDNPPCVNPGHLFLGTHADNDRDRDQKNRVRHGSKHPCAVLTEQQVVEIRRRYQPRRVTQKQLAKEFGVGWKAIKAIVYGKTWKRVTCA